MSVIGQGNYELEQMVVHDPIEEAVMASIQATLLDHTPSEQGVRSTYADFTSGHDVIFKSEGAPVEALAEISRRVQEFQRQTGNLVGKTSVHASLRPFSYKRLYGWHADNINNAFVAATQASPEGLSGSVKASSWGEAVLLIQQEAIEDEDLSQLKTVRITHPPVRSLIHLPINVLHRSPPAGPKDSDEFRLLVNAVVRPNFMLP